MRLKQTLLVSGMGIALLTVMGQSQGVVLGSHDEPIVIDNGPVVVSRKIRNTEHGPFKEDGKDSWQIHHTKSFAKLHARVKRGQQWGEYVPFDLDGIDRVALELVDTGTGLPQRMALSTKGALSKTARIHASVDLLLSANTDPREPKIKYQFTPKGLDTYRIKHLVTYDDADGRDKKKTICLRDATAPHEGECEASAPPDEIRVVICVKDDRDCPASEQ